MRPKASATKRAVRPSASGSCVAPRSRRSHAHPRSRTTRQSPSLSIELDRQPTFKFEYRACSTTNVRVRVEMSTDNHLSSSSPSTSSHLDRNTTFEIVMHPRSSIAPHNLSTSQGSLAQKSVNLPKFLDTTKALRRSPSQSSSGQYPYSRHASRSTPNSPPSRNERLSMRGSNMI